jgi:hypothetical protein
MEAALYHALKRIKTPGAIKAQEQPKRYRGASDDLYGMPLGALFDDDSDKTSARIPSMDEQHGDVPDAETAGSGAKWRQPSGGAGTAPNPRDYFKPDAPPSLILEQLSPAIHSDDRTPK